MKDNQLKGIQNPLKQLFELEGITQVVCVDDQYRELSEETLDNVIGTLKSKKPIELQKVPGKISELQGIAWDHEKVWEDRVKKIWEDADTEKRREIYNQLNQLFPELGNDDIKYSQLLRDIMAPSADVEFKELSFNIWEENKKEYLKDEVVSQTLFLFDHELSEEKVSKKGMDIICEVMDQNPQIICGLWSHLFEPDEEYDKWEEFAKLYGVSKGHFVLISKKRMQEGQDGFLPAVRRTILSKYCKKLKEQTSNIIENAFKTSKDEINELDIYDFEDIVFRSSLKEGIWEPDTLFRLYNLFQRDTARKEALKNDDLHSYTEKIREIHKIPVTKSDVKNNELWKIQRRELYEDGEHINSLYMPIELGDIFQKTKENNKKYILIAQPCSLRVRAKEPTRGKRSFGFSEAILAEIVSNCNRKDGSCYDLLYFDETDGNSHYVDFNKAHSVLLCILDLCVYNTDGKAKMHIDSECPSLVIPSWEIRFDILKKKLKKIVENYKDGQLKGHNKEILNSLLPKSSLSGNGLFKGEVDLHNKGKETLEYFCRRIGRLCQPRAGEMLTKYAHHISRSAFEHDIGKARE